MRKTTVQKLFVALVLSVALLCSLAVSAFAAETITQTVTVTQTIENSPTVTEYSYYLLPMDKDNPMPKGTKDNGRYELTLSGNDSKTFDLEFKVPGIYNYELRRTKSAPDGEEVSPNVHPFGYKVVNGENGLEVIPYTCYDVYMEIRGEDGKAAGITLKNHVYGKSDSTNPTSTPGKDGQDGKDGTDGKDGKDGADGQKGDKGDPGADGKDGTNGTNGTDGKNGTNGTNGRNGTNGKDGVTTTNVVTRTVNKIVNTGDPYQVGLWLGLIVLSGGALILSAIYRRKKETEDE